ncbi:LutC/YkgG family protein [Yersinia aldovae]|uniref:Uncharacterized ACR, YkgG family COG1556 n=1 Tax=Yersinia aldovae TaxID=29483 RepID=A0A0T9TSE6_YERAL|nr:LUD domain-containing protein [Yersinia aldovae]CNK03599.1 Uncharacterised ACR%2C YkgG family COG1556 [Yersinia aldovae]CNK99543.1 Uncharacterised ACR%2C YkgG family COG1556 [Yersinia aldovae]CNL21087.1 Uncharacterised ACR%2C YkgG family COG1556 [Yersinia aldovae]
MSDRSEILNAVKQHMIPATPLPAIPTFSPDTLGSSHEFGEMLKIMGGIWDTTFIHTQPDDAALTRYITELFAADACVCSAVAGITGNREITINTVPSSLKDIDVAIVRGRFGVAETGSVFLSEEELCVNSLGYLAQHLVVLLDIATIVPDLHVAYRNRAFFDAKYAVLVTGPSATADIEGVLIFGAQGVRSLRVIALGHDAIA